MHAENPILKERRWPEILKGNRITGGTISLTSSHGFSHIFAELPKKEQINFIGDHSCYKSKPFNP